MIIEVGGTAACGRGSEKPIPSRDQSANARLVFSGETFETILFSSVLRIR
jgi:hypothetical protein